MARPPGQGPRGRERELSVCLQGSRGWLSSGAATCPLAAPHALRDGTPSPVVRAPDTPRMRAYTRGLGQGLGDGGRPLGVSRSSCLSAGDLTPELGDLRWCAGSRDQRGSGTQAGLRWVIPHPRKLVGEAARSARLRSGLGGLPHSSCASGSPGGSPEMGRECLSQRPITSSDHILPHLPHLIG